jgi:thioredoxin reductase (NADPH)
MTNIKHYSLLILGSGPAGCTAMIYASRANIECAMITGLEQGGQLIKSAKIANWPGEPQEIAGTTLMEKMMTQAKNFSPNVLSDFIVKADLTKRPFYLKGDADEYSCNALIIASGASARFLGLPSEQKYVGQGVSSCAVCDGFFYRNKDVVVVGGGSTAIEDALYLAKIAKTVTVIHRRDSFRAEVWEIEQLKKEPNVKFEYNSVVTEILGNEHGVTGVEIKDVTNETRKKLEAEGIFIAIGYQPNTKIFVGQLETEHDYIVTGHNYASASSVSGVFAAGDVVAGNYRQAVIAAGSGCTAALDAKNYLAKLK